MSVILDLQLACADESGLPTEAEAAALRQTAQADIDRLHTLLAALPTAG